MQPVAVAREREEVVPVEQDVHAHVLEPAHGVAQVAVLDVLRLELDAQPHGGIGEHAASLFPRRVLAWPDRGRRLEPGGRRGER